MSAALQPFDRSTGEAWTGSAPANDAAPAERTLLRFITCGSVDDGKSTLIGRLLFEAGSVPEDTLAALHADSARLGNAGGALDYSLLVDGLQAEREQGITIDVAYRYFATPRRSFIVADTPGHEQYTRNMATGASGADAAIILIDARKGVLPQTRRHAMIASLVGVRHVAVAINKIDLAGYDEGTVSAIDRDIRQAVATLGFRSVSVIPVSAFQGDNVAERSTNTPWYDGPTLLGWLETIDTAGDGGQQGFVMPVQWVNRPHPDFRGFSGTIAGGMVRSGERVLILPGGYNAAVGRIVTFDGDRAEAGEGSAVTLTLDREVDVSRGDVLVSASAQGRSVAKVQTHALARLLVTAERDVREGDTFSIRIGAATANGTVDAVLGGVDIDNLKERDADVLAMNDLGLVRLRFDRPLVVAPYRLLGELGALILVDKLTNATAAMGIVLVEPADAPGPRVVAFRQAADRALKDAIGDNWRREIAPVASWRIGSALLFGLVFAVLTDSIILGIAAAVLDAIVRPVLRFLHRRFWKALWERKHRKAGPLQDGDGI